MNENNKKQIWLFVGILLIAGSFYFFFSNERTGARHQVSIGDTIIKVEIAQTEAEREQGLSGHTPLADDEGMLFIFDTPQRLGFWMKDMLFPIDIIWLSADKKIVYIEKNLSPDTYPKVFGPKEYTQYVLEVNTGLADKYNWQVGDEVKF